MVANDLRDGTSTAIDLPATEENDLRDGTSASSFFRFRERMNDATESLIVDATESLTTASHKKSHARERTFPIAS